MSRIRKKAPSDRTLEERNKDGEYELVEPLDYLILQELPDEGTLMGRYYPITTNVKSLLKTFPELNAPLLSTRLRLLHMQGLIITIPTAGSRSGWQRTEKGKELLQAWQEQQK